MIVTIFLWQLSYKDLLEEKNRKKDLVKLNAFSIVKEVNSYCADKSSSISLSNNFPKILPCLQVLWSIFMINKLTNNLNYFKALKMV